ncbi:GGDEF domain-containing protein [Mycolicibacterium grossiae]|uniref:GGDEF domain-containing protein n=1 Tax=Mycolicibacterium grossiae TaxID=1552759 RepID=UPI000877CA2F|nr:GGDEF domain-containing protein [Mycolicibacterium grossiae]QEM44562.1 GGDEF domain-containing protein [Mycolicibacterium grossiae]
MNTWLSEEDHFEWLSIFLRSRGLDAKARLAMATVTGSAALVPLSAMMRRRVPLESVIVGSVGVVVCLFMTWFWLTRWPTRRQSLYSVTLGAVCVSAWSLTEPRAAVAALACMVLAVTGGYIALLHSTRTLAFNVVIAVATACVATYRLAESIDAATAIAAFWLVWLLTIVAPVCIRGALKALRHYATRSDQDPLTGLLNRRAFAAQATRMVLSNPSLSEANPTLHVLMIDLDDFKSVNDTHGHAAGDDVLRRAAQAIVEHTPRQGVTCRAGGEEFLVALRDGPRQGLRLADELCEAIRVSCDGVGASIGVASMAMRDGSFDWTASIDRLVAAADTAMYAAKRAGGNRVHVAEE